jgi:SPP1 family predicted phage head-tail adaptor
MILNGKVINPGELRTQIALQKRTSTEDAGGFRPDAGTTQVSVWSKWTNAHGNEAWTAELSGAVEPATALIRYLAGIDGTWLVVKGSKTYEIVSMDNIQERNEYIELKLKRAEVS